MHNVSVSVTNNSPVNKKQPLVKHQGYTAGDGRGGGGLVGYRGAGVEGSGGRGMLVTPVSQSVTTAPHFNHACISVFIYNELHS